MVSRMSPATRWMYALLSVFAVAAAMMFTNLYYTAHEQRKSDQRWCALLASLDQPQVPATTERGRQVQQQIHQLRHDLGCD